MTNSLGFLRTEDGRSSGAIGWRGELDRNSESDLLSSHSLGYGQHCRSAVPLSLLTPSSSSIFSATAAP